MNLQEKVLKLRMDAAIAMRHASFWQKAIHTHGEEKATAFYSHLGLNHLETKSTVDWEGLSLSREPKEHEKLAIKGIATAQESGKLAVTTILLSLRKELISDGLKGIRKLNPATYHELTLAVPAELRSSLRDRLIKTYKQGRLLVAQELGAKKSIKQLEGDEFDDLDLLVDLTDSRVVNDLQARIIAATTRQRLLGLSGAELWSAVEKEVSEGSTGYIDRAAQGVANKALNIGRSDEAQERKDEWKTVEYSALLDQNVCGPCSADDGQESTNEDDLTPTPNPDCEGGDWCRCVHVFIAI